MTCPFCAPGRRRPEADRGAPSAAAITARQREVLTFICAVRAKRGYSPSIREIGETFGITSTNGVNDYLRALVRKGCLERDANTARSLVPTKAGMREAGFAPKEVGHGE